MSKQKPQKRGLGWGKTLPDGTVECRDSKGNKTLWNRKGEEILPFAELDNGRLYASDGSGNYAE